MTLNKRISKTALALGGAASVLAIAQASAQTDTSSQAEGTDTIVVTAQHREERLQDVPFTIKAITGDSLEKSGLTGTRKLTQMVPNLVFARGNTTQAPYLRGVGTRNAGVGDESSVAVYIDGVYQPANSGLDFDFLGVERVEVLSGPQGTLYGRNATGGLINVITRKPQQEFSGKVVATLGNFSERSVQSYMTAGVTDTIAISASAGFYRDDGYLKDIVRGGPSGARLSDQIRLKLLFTPTDNFEATLIGSYQFLDDTAAQRNQPFNGNTRALASPPIPPILATQPYETAHERLLQSFTNTKSVDLKMRWELEHFNVETISSVNKNRSRVEVDNDGTTKPIQFITVVPDTIYYTNEVRVLSSGTEGYSWMAGAFFINGTAKYDPFEIFVNDTLIRSITTRQEIGSWAVFADGNIDLTDKLRFTAGVRYTQEDREFTSSSSGVVVVPKMEASFNNVTFRGNLQYALNDDSNVYVSFNRGFKSGLFNGFASSVAAAQPVLPEVIDAYEIGIKASLTPWLDTTVAVFHYDHDNLQLSTKGITGLTTLSNATSTSINGAEFEINATVMSDLNLHFHAAYLDATYDDFTDATAFAPTGLGGNMDISPVDVTGNNIIRSPEYSFGFNFDYERETQIGTFGTAGNIVHSAKYYWDPVNRLAQPAYTVVNAEVSFSPSSLENLRFAVWGRNLTDELIFNQLLNGSVSDLVSFERPRSYGVSVSLDW